MRSKQWDRQQEFQADRNAVTAVVAEWERKIMRSKQWDPRLIVQGDKATIVWPFGTVQASSIDPRRYLVPVVYCICCPACKGPHQTRADMASCWVLEGYEGNKDNNSMSVGTAETREDHSSESAVGSDKGA